MLTLVMVLGLLSLEGCQSSNAKNAFEIPEGKRQSKGTAIVNLLQLAPNEKIATLIAIDAYIKIKKI